VNQKGNILLTLSAESPIPSAISSLLLELDIHISPDRNTVVVDHLNYDTLSASESHDVLLISHPSPLRPDLKNFFEGQGKIAFPRSVPQELGNKTPLLVPILRASNTAYSYNLKDEAETVEDPFAVGGQVSLVSAMQARNSARFTVFGSSEALENKWFDAKIKGLDGKQSVAGNRLFAKQVSAWTFQETGVLHVGKIEHHLGSINQKYMQSNGVARLGDLNPKIYRIKNDVVSLALPLL
jgi:oligosaccharyltransferase complex subunit beta